MGVGVLDDEPEHAFRRLHGDMEAHRSPKVVEVDIARSDRELVEQFRDCLAEGGERSRW